MKTNTVLLVATFTALLASASIFTACHDDLEGDSRKYNDGKLHFQFLFDNKEGAWNEDGTPQQQTRLHEPLDVQLPEGMTQPLYLHCTELNDIEAPDIAAVPDSAVTRGQRITREAFDGRGLLQNLGLYGTVGSDEALPATVIKRSTLTNNNDGWWTKDVELNFDAWPVGESGDFYGFAPVPGAEEGDAPCYDVDFVGTPTIYFEMLPDEAYNKDILTAHTPEVTQSVKDANGIQLKFHHVLSAIKFKVEDASFMTYPVGITSPVNKYLKITDLTLQGIYKRGTAELGNEYTDTSDGRTNNWSYETTEDNLGSCTISNINKTSAADDLLINTDEHCLMVLPQVVPDGAKLIVTANLYDDNLLTTLYKENITFEVELGGKNIEWKPGYSYTYKLSKDETAYEYTLTSMHNNDNGGTFIFSADESSKQFAVTSYVTRLKSDNTQNQAAVPWHLEYSEDGTNWTRGLPSAFTLKNASGDEIDGSSDFDGSTTAATYTLISTGNENAMLPSVKYLREHEYNVDEGGYYDLSLHDGFNTEPRGRTTANCYIINGYGKFKFPLVFGNAWKRGGDNKEAYSEKIFDALKTNQPEQKEHRVFRDHKGNVITKPWMFGDGHDEDHKGQLWSTDNNLSAEVLWSDASSNLLTNIAISDDKDYIQFEITQDNVKPANILLAVKDNGVIAWSWHIWVTDYDFSETIPLTYNSYTMNVAKYDLGWHDIEVKRGNGSSSYTIKVVQNDKMGKEVPHIATQEAETVFGGSSIIRYQYGRKDPFPYKSVKPSSVTYAADGSISDIQYSTTDFTVTQSSTIGNVMYSIQQPNCIFSSNGINWFKEVDNNGSEINQQLYPCWNPDLYRDQKGTYDGSDMSKAYNFKAEHTKTIYDPSPEGFIIPNSGLITMLQNDGTITTSNIARDADEKEFTAPFSYVKTNSGLVFHTMEGHIGTAGVYNQGANAVAGNISSTSPYISIGADAVATLRPVRPIEDPMRNQIKKGKYYREVIINGQQLAWTMDEPRTSSVTWKWYGVNDPSTVSFTVDGETSTLQDLLEDPNVEISTSYVRNVKVYFEYTGGWITGILNRGKNDEEIRFSCQGGFLEIPRASYNSQTMPNYIEFHTTGWKSDNNASGLQKIVRAYSVTNNATITNCSCDLKITYYETIE